MNYKFLIVIDNLGFEIDNNYIKDIEELTDFELKLKNKKLHYQKVSRLRNKVREYIQCNDFSHFVTLTFNENKINRYSYDEILSKLSIFFNNFKKRKDKNFKYCIVPEYHKLREGDTERAIHFHGAFKIDKKYLSKAKTKTGKDKKYMGQQVYNFDLYSQKFGFNNLTCIVHKGKVSSYCTKYITKDVINVSNRQKLICSKGLKTATVEATCYSDDFELELDVPFMVQNNYIKKIFFDTEQELTDFLANYFIEFNYKNNYIRKDMKFNE